PYWESYPAWSPDSTRIAYLQSGEDKWVYYAPWQLAVIDVASGKSRIPAPIDRCFTHPRWSADGRHVFALVEQSLVTHVARIDLADGSLSAQTMIQCSDVVAVGDAFPKHYQRVQQCQRIRAAGYRQHNGLMRQEE
ncbi:MAG: PD40 domain-containing protein, partial [Anaerolineae bacterium]|nr:PD40 domain-containing protein [Anaerolineae bacterium]